MSNEALIKQLVEALGQVRSALADWVEIADKEDDRASDWQALAAADAALKAAGVGADVFPAITIRDCIVKAGKRVELRDCGAGFWRICRAENESGQMACIDPFTLFLREGDFRKEKGAL